MVMSRPQPAALLLIVIHYCVILTTGFELVRFLWHKLLAEWDVFLTYRRYNDAYHGENMCSFDGLNVLHCVLISFLSRVDTVLNWGGSYHLRW